MNHDDSWTPTPPLEGEGNYSAARGYYRHLGDAIDAGDLEACADAERRAFEAKKAEQLK